MTNLNPTVLPTLSLQAPLARKMAHAGKIGATSRAAMAATRASTTMTGPTGRDRRAACRIRAFPRQVANILTALRTHQMNRAAMVPGLARTHSPDISLRLITSLSRRLQAISLHHRPRRRETSHFACRHLLAS